MNEIDEICVRSILEEFEIFVDDLRLKYKLTSGEVCNIIRETLNKKEADEQMKMIWGNSNL